MGKPARVLYVAVFLSEESAAVLRSVSIGSKVFCHHLTLVFRPGMDQEGEFYQRLGEVVELKPFCLHGDGLGNAAMEVKIPGNLPCSNDHPHVTICTDGRGPAYSNELIASEPFSMACSDVWPKLVGRIGFQMTDGTTIYDEEQYLRLFIGETLID